MLPMYNTNVCTIKSIYMNILIYNNGICVMCIYIVMCIHILRTYKHQKRSEDRFLLFSFDGRKKVFKVPVNINN